MSRTSDVGKALVDELFSGAGPSQNQVIEMLHRACSNEHRIRLELEILLLKAKLVRLRSREQQLDQEVAAVLEQCRAVEGSLDERIEKIEQGDV